VFSKAYYAANDFLAQSLDPPLGSGPYAISDFRQGTYVTYKRRPDYWAADLPVNRGRYNFDEIRFDYYRDPNTLFEAFQRGLYDVRVETDPGRWQTAYSFPAARDGRVVRDERVTRRREAASEMKALPPLEEVT